MKYGQDYVALAILENGMLLVIRDDGTAVSTDGEVYANVCKRLLEDEYRNLGWVKGCSQPITLKD